MPTTPAERKALIFLGAVAALGVGARVVAAARGGGGENPGPMQPALERQLMRAEAASRRAKAERAEREAGKGVKKRGKAAAKTPRVAPPRAAPHAATRDTTALGGTGPMDVDTADTLALATLPGVGPGLARRIVADRMAHGLFGGTQGLDQVAGVGPKLLERLAPHVTFSGPPRPIHGKGPPDGATGRSTPHAAARRRRATR